MYAVVRTGGKQYRVTAGDILDGMGESCHRLPHRSHQGLEEGSGARADIGDNVARRSKNIDWYQAGPLLDYLETVNIASDRNLIDMRLPVQYVLRPGPDFRGFSGTLASGVLRVGDEVACLPSRQESKISAIHGPDGEFMQLCKGFWCDAFPPFVPFFSPKISLKELRQ